MNDYELLEITGSVYATAYRDYVAVELYSHPGIGSGASIREAIENAIRNLGGDVLAEYKRVLQREEDERLNAARYRGMVSDGFGAISPGRCSRCGADMIVVRPGDIRCSMECYLDG